MLTRDQILGSRPQRQVIHVPEWNDDITIQALTVGTAMTLLEENSIVDVVIASCINEDGSMMFSPEDRNALQRQMSLSTGKLIAEAVFALNGMNRVAVEALAKNSEPGPNGASSSG